MLELINISKYYKTENGVSLGINKVNLKLELGEFVVITGESGSGKSTLLNVLSALDTYEDGDLLIFGEETFHFTSDDWENYRAQYIGFIFQKYNVIESYTVYQNVVLALEVQGYQEDLRKERALELIEKVGLTHRKNQRASKLSGGEKQRLVIARSLAKDCPLIIADEPTGNLDSESSKGIIDLLHDISKDKLVIVSTHDYDEVSHYATRKIRMKDGTIVEDYYVSKPKTTTNKLVKEPIQTKFKDILRFSFRNLFSTPKRLLFTTLLLFLTVSVFSVTYAFLMSGQDVILGDLKNETSSMKMNIYDKQGDFIDINDINDTGLSRSSTIYFENDSYYSSYGTVITGDNHATPRNSIVMENSLSLNEKDIHIGRAPENSNEVILNTRIYDTLKKTNVGFNIALLPASANTFNPRPSHFKSYKVVGVTDLGSLNSIFFHDDIFQDEEFALLSALKKSIDINIQVTVRERSSQITSVKTITVDKAKVRFDSSLEKNSIMINSNILPDPTFVSWRAAKVDFGPRFDNSFSTESLSYDNLFFTTPNAYDDLVLSTSYLEPLLDAFFGDNYQPSGATVFVRDLKEARNFINNIDRSKYRILYANEQLSDDLLFSQVEYTIIAVFLLVLFGVLLFSALGVVLRNINLSRNNDFAIFRSVGASKKSLQTQFLIEQIIITLIAVTLSLVLLLVLNVTVYQLNIAMRYLSWYHYLILILFVTFLSIRNAINYNKKIFNLSVISTLEGKMEVYA
ncbi:ABC transporter ATP-binding protein [Acholeplasma sp. OttesenSCG-928-E16]|nr:ABC transporter ATP-binding protein [Acholeplasma sp. OttesenSCG-928-E16]